MTKVQRPIIHGRDHEHGGADPIRTAYEVVGSGAGGGGMAVFAIQGNNFNVTTVPFVMDTVATGTIHFYRSDLTFGSTGGTTAATNLAQIAGPGFYLIALQTTVATTVEITSDLWVNAQCVFGDADYDPTTDGAKIGNIGSSFWQAWMEGYFQAETDPMGGNQIVGTHGMFLAGCDSDTRLTLNYLHPISLTDTVAFPVTIYPRFNCDSSQTANVDPKNMACFGFRLSDPLDSWFSD